ncbi:MAG: hypothetical protein J6B34_00515 [Clostridia bacterium]|nr:hypothetical protein [Clostridia bacterium]
MGIRLSKRQFLSIALIGLILISLLMTVGMSIKNDKIIEIPLESWKTGYATYSEGQGWYVDYNMTDKKEDYHVLYGPYISLKKGTYTADIHYKTDINRTCQAYANGEEGYYIECAKGILSKSRDRISYDFELKDDVGGFELLVDHNGSGSLSVYSIVIRENSNGIKRIFTTASIVIGIAILLLFTLTLDTERRGTALALIAITALSVLPQLFYAYNGGHDFKFHLMRIEAIAKGLQNGDFPVRMSSVVLDGYGYPTSIYYGDILLYFPALLRLCGFTLMGSYNMLMAFISALTTLISYISFKGIFKNGKISIILTLSYLLASYRFENVYVRVAVGEYCAIMMLPLVALGIYRIYTEDTSDTRAYLKASLPLAIGMSGLILTHILTTEMVVLVLAVIALILIRKTIRRATLLVYLKAILETVLLSLFFVVPFLDYYINVDVSINQIIDSGDKLIQGAGIYLEQLFAFNFNIVFGKPFMFLTVGIPLLAIIVVGLFVMIFITRLKNKRIILYLSLSLLFIFMSTRYFPWDWLSGTGAIGNMLSQIQFPWRFLGLATLFLVLLMGEVLTVVKERHRVSYKALLVGISVLTVISLSIFTFNFLIYSAREQNHLDSSSITPYAVGYGEYLLTDCNIYSSYNDGRVHYTRAEEIRLLERKGNYISIYLDTGDAESEIRMPLYNYRGFVARDKDGNKIDTFDGPNKTVAFKVPSGYRGEITVDFESPWYWRASEIISLLFFIFLLIKPIIISKKEIICDKASRIINKIKSLFKGKATHRAEG